MKSKFGDSLSFQSNVTVLKCNQKKGIAFVDCLINRETVSHDSFTFEFEITNYEWAFYFGFVKAEIDEGTHEIKIHQIESPSLDCQCISKSIYAYIRLLSLKSG